MIFVYFDIFLIKANETLNIYHTDVYVVTDPAVLRLLQSDQNIQNSKIISVNEDKCGTQHAISNCAISVADFIVLVPCTSVAWIKVVRTIYRIKCRNIKGRSSKLCKAK